MNRKWIFYIFCAVFFAGILYICFRKESDVNSGNSLYEDLDKTPRADDDLYRRAPEEKVGELSHAEKVDIALKSTIKVIWTEYDKDKSGTLDKKEALDFVKTIQQKTKDRYGIQFEKELDKA